MSISEFFNKKSRAVLATVALAFGVAGGYAGHEIVQAQVETQRSEFTIPQVMEAELSAKPEGSKLTDDQWELQQATQVFKYGQLPAGNLVSDESIANQQVAIAKFNVRIEEMAAAKAAGRDVTAMAVSFVNDLRFAENLTEKDYGGLVKEYNARVGVDVTAQTGNWQKGIAYQQEAQLEIIFDQIGNLFGGGDDEDLTEAQLSAKVGKIMAQEQTAEDLKTAGGTAGGALLGGLLLVPALIRARRNHPKLP